MPGGLPPATGAGHRAGSPWRPDDRLAGAGRGRAAACCARAEARLSQAHSKQRAPEPPRTGPGEPASARAAGRPHQPAMSEVGQPVRRVGCGAAPGALLTRRAPLQELQQAFCSFASYGKGPGSSEVGPGPLCGPGLLQSAGLTAWRAQTLMEGKNFAKLCKDSGARPGTDTRTGWGGAL